MKHLARVSMLVAAAAAAVAIVGFGSGRSSGPPTPVAPAFGPNPSVVHVAGRGYVSLNKLAMRAR